MTKYAVTILGDSVGSAFGINHAGLVVGCLGSIAPGINTFPPAFQDPQEENLLVWWTPQVLSPPSDYAVSIAAAAHPPYCFCPPRINDNNYATGLGADINPETGLGPATLAAYDTNSNLPFAFVAERVLENPGFRVDINNGNQVLISGGLTFILTPSVGGGGIATLQGGVPIETSPQLVSTFSRAINDLGDVVGGVGNGPAWEQCPGFFYSGGGLTTIDGFTLCDINNLRVAVGFSQAAGASSSPVGFVELSVPGSSVSPIFSDASTPEFVDGNGDGNCLAINDSNMIVGTVQSADGTQYPFVCQIQEGAAQPPQNLNDLVDLPASPGFSGNYTLVSANDINVNGVIVGSARSIGDGKLYPYVAAPIVPFQLPIVPKKLPLYWWVISLWQWLNLKGLLGVAPNPDVPSTETGPRQPGTNPNQGE
jgi:hypothetical protein